MTHITTGLPLSELKKVVIQENNDPLVEIVPSERIQLLSDHKYLDARVRKKTHERLLEASLNLPAGYTLLLVTAYRPIWMQRELYRRRMRQFAKKYPFKMIFQYAKWKKMVGQYTSPPGAPPTRLARRWM